MKPKCESLYAQTADRKATIDKSKEEIYNMKFENKRQMDMLQDKLSAEVMKLTGLSKYAQISKN